MSYKQSIFNQEVEIGNEIYLFNTLTGKLGIIEKSLKNLSTFTDNSLERLYYDGFLVDSEITTKDEYNHFFSLRSKNSSTLGILFTTTTTCNLQCSYCFENRIQRQKMDETTLTNSINWLQKELSKPAINSLKLILFGGEPMLEPEIAKTLFSRINEFCDSNDIKRYPYEAITNGIFNDTEMLLELKKLGLRDVQITFDGSETIHNERRRSKDKIDKYWNIIENLKIYSALFKVTIKINFDKSTIGSIATLLDDLLQSDPDLNKKCLIKFEPIALYKESKNFDYSNSKMFDPTSTFLSKSFSDVLKLGRKKGFNLDMSAVFPTPCMVTQENSYLLEPNGNLRSCISAFGLDEFGIGNTSKNSFENDRTKFRTTVETSEQHGCIEKKCAYMPICDGGCKYELSLEDKSVETLQCKYHYFEGIIPTYIKELTAQRSSFICY